MILQAKPHSGTMNKRSLENLKHFKAGQSGNPGGKPVHARNALSNAFLKALSEDFQANGTAAIQKLREERPEKYCELVASILPKESNVSIEQSGTVTHEHVSVSEVSDRIAEVLRAGAESVSEKPLPH